MVDLGLAGLVWLFLVSLFTVLPAALGLAAAPPSGPLVRTGMVLAALPALLLVESAAARRWGQTPGRGLQRVQLVRRDGAPLTLRDVRRRTVLAWGPGLFVLATVLGLLPPAAADGALALTAVDLLVQLLPGRRTAHDLLTGTLVVEGPYRGCLEQ